MIGVYIASAVLIFGAVVIGAWWLVSQADHAQRSLWEDEE